MMGGCDYGLRKIMEANWRGRATRPLPQIFECPKCSARMPFSRAELAQIDASGFESYRLSCRACAVPLAGVVDPYDETLLLSELKE